MLIHYSYSHIFIYAYTHISAAPCLVCPQPVRFHVAFQPLRPFKTNAEFIIAKPSGGRWRYHMRFEAEEPEVTPYCCCAPPVFPSCCARLPSQTLKTLCFRRFVALMLHAPLPLPLPPGG